MLGGVGLGAHEAEDHVGLVRGRGPDLLAVDDEVIAVLDAAGLQRGEVGTGVRFRVALAPDHLAAQGGTDVLALLLLGAQLEQRRHEHRDALVAEPGRDAGAAELLDDQLLLEHVRRGTVAAVFARHGAAGVAMLDQQGLPGLLGRARTRSGRKRGGLVAVVGDEGTDAVAERFVRGAQLQVHGGLFLYGAWIEGERGERGRRRKEKEGAGGRE